LSLVSGAQDIWMRATRLVEFLAMAILSIL